MVEAPVEPLDLLEEGQARRIDLIWSAGMVISVGLVVAVLASLRGVGLPLLLSFALAYALNPLVGLLERRGFKRTAATATVFGGVALAVTGFVLYLIPVFRAQATKLPEFFNKASNLLFPWIELSFGVSVPALIRQRTAELGGEAADLLTSAGPAVAAFAAAAAGNTARLLLVVLGLLVVPVLGFFFLKDYWRIVALAQSLIPRPAVGLASRRFAQVDEVLSAFVRGQLTVGAILSVIYATGLSIARIDMAVLIGLVAGFGNMVPYLGSAIGITLSLLAVVLSWHGPWQLLVILLTFVLAHALEGLAITPRIVGEKVGLPPVAVILAVLFFGELFGFVGILLAVPTSAVLKVVLQVVLKRYKRSALYTGEAESK